VNPPGGTVIAPGADLLVVRERPTDRAGFEAVTSTG
jgi:hypothetical protein